MRGRLFAVVLLVVTVLVSGCIGSHGGSKTTTNNVLTAEPVGTEYTVKGVAGSSFVVRVRVNHPVSKVLVSPVSGLSVSAEPLGITDGVLSVRITLKAGKSFDGTVPLHLILVDPDGNKADVFLTVNVKLTYPAFGRFVHKTSTLRLGLTPATDVLVFRPLDKNAYHIASASVVFKPGWLEVKPLVKGDSVVLRFTVKDRPPFESGIITVKVAVLVGCSGVVKKYTLPLTYSYSYRPPSVNMNDYTFTVLSATGSGSYTFVSFIEAFQDKKMSIVYAGLKPPSPDTIQYELNPSIELGNFRSDRPVKLTADNLVELLKASSDAGIGKFYLLLSSSSGNTVEVVVTKAGSGGFSKVVSVEAFKTGDRYYVYYRPTGYCSVFPATSSFRFLHSEKLDENLSIAVFEGSGNLSFTVDCGGVKVKYVVNKTVSLNVTNVTPTAGMTVKLLDALGKGALVLSGNEFRLKTLSMFSNGSFSTVNASYHVYPTVILKHAPDNPEALSGVVYVPAFNFKKVVVLKKVTTLLTPSGELADEYRAPDVFVSGTMLGDVVGYLVVYLPTEKVMERFVLDPVNGLFSRLKNWPPENPDRFPFVSALYYYLSGRSSNVTVSAYSLTVGRTLNLTKVSVNPLKLTLLPGEYALGIKVNGVPIGLVILPRYFFGENPIDTGYATDGANVYKYTVSASGMELTKPSTGEPFTAPTIPGVPLPPAFRYHTGSVELISPEPYGVEAVAVNGQKVPFGYLNFVKTVVLVVNGVKPSDELTITYVDGKSETLKVTGDLIALSRYDSPFSGVFNALAFVLG